MVGQPANQNLVGEISAVILLFTGLQLCFHWDEFSGNNNNNILRLFVVYQLGSVKVYCFIVLLTFNSSEAFNKLNVMSQI